VLRAEHAQEVGGVVHCFSGDPSLQAAGLELGFSFGITGIVTFPKANALRSAVRGLPLERLVIETDSPYLAPVPHRGRRNEPAYVVEVARSLAEIKGVPLEDVARITTANARRLFGLDRREAVPPGLLAYPWKDALYLNLTNRCTLACTFCLKREGHGLGDIPLGLAREPTEEEVRAAIAGAGPLAGFSEVVFCGVGEPLLRPDLVIALGTWLRGQGARVRVNTDGLGSLIHGRDLANELRGAVDAVSVSLNAPDAATHERLCRPPSGLGAAAFEAVCGFIRRAVATLPEVTATAVALPGLDLDAVASLARSLGARFRARPLAGDWRADGIDLE
jgi:TatD DNase family protein